MVEFQAQRLPSRGRTGRYFSVTVYSHWALKSHSVGSCWHDLHGNISELETNFQFTEAWLFQHSSSMYIFKCKYKVFLFFVEFFLNLLGWHWLIKLYRFQGYNPIIHHVYIVLCVHHPKSSLLPSPFVPRLLSSAPSHSLSLWYSPYCCPCLRGFFLCWIPPPYSPNQPNPLPLWQLSVCSLYLWHCFYFIC